MSAMICSGPATQPARQPIIRSSLDADQPGIDRVADHHLLAGFHGGQQHVQDPVQSAGDADALGTGVIAVAGGSGHVRAGGLTQRQPVEVAASGQQPGQPPGGVLIAGVGRR
jgi:hypothetical protein